MLTSAPRRAHSFSMLGGNYRALFLIACFAVTVVASLAAMTGPASAHTDGPHAVVQSASQDAAKGDGHNAESFCHQSGTCVAQILPVAPTINQMDTVPTTLFGRIAAVRAASVVPATDPPPPRS